VTVARRCTTDDAHCITCGDVAVEMTVITVDTATGLAVCEADDGRRETIEIALVPDVRLADRLLAHAGTAIARHGAGL
jgi:hydrogenase maturation factor